YQVSFSPGAIRNALIVQGNDLPVRGFWASMKRVALSQVSHGTIPPLPSGRSGMRSDIMARTLSGLNPALQGRWQACMPRLPRQPRSEERTSELQSRDNLV